MSLTIKAARGGPRGFTPAPVPGVGDPGLFGGLIGAAKGLFTGGPVGAITGAVEGFRDSGSRRMAQAPPALAGPRGIPGFPLPSPRNLAPPQGSRGAMIAPSSNGAVMGTTIQCASGFHPNKSSYFLRNGTFVPKGSRCVRNRRRNAMNPRALDRAIGRVDSAKRIQSKLREIETKKHTKAGNKK